MPNLVSVCETTSCCAQASTFKMQCHTLWVIIIFPFAFSFPANENKPLERFKNGSLPVLIPKRTTLDEILKAYNIQDLESRIPNRAKRSTCPVDKILLQKLAESINKVQTYVPKPNHGKLSLNQPLALTASGTPCDIAKAKLVNNVDTLNIVYIVMLVNGSSLNEEEFQRLNNLYQNVQENFEKDFKIIQQSAVDDNKEQVEKVLHEKNSLENRLHRMINAIHYNITIQKKLRENFIDLILLRISAKDYDTAAERFIELGDENAMYAIVEKMETNEKNNEDLLYFIKELPWLSHRLAGYKAMLMKKTFVYSIITMEHDFNELLSYGNDPDVVREGQDTIDYVRENIKQLVDERISAMAGLITTKKPKNYKNLIDFSEGRTEAFNAHLEELIEKIYTENPESVRKILIFSDALTQIAQSARVYIKLSQLLEGSKQKTAPVMLKISFKLKQLSLLENHKNTPDDVKESMDEFKEKLPQAIRAIIWGRVCMKNTALGGFLHVHTGTTGSEFHKNIRLSGKRDLWEFDGYEDGEFFKILHEETGDYLTVDGNDMSSKVGVFTEDINSSSPDKLWLLEDSRGNAGEFYIKNKRRNQYLNAERQAPRGEGMRNKGTAFPVIGRELDDSSEWLIIDSKFC